MGIEWLEPLGRGFSVTLQFFVITLVLSLPLFTKVVTSTHASLYLCF